MLCPQKDQGKSAVDNWLPELAFAATSEPMEYTCRTAKVEMAGETTSCQVAPDFYTEKRNCFQLLMAKKMEKETGFQNWHQVDRGRDTAENSWERALAPEVVCMLQDRVTSQAACYSVTWVSGYQSWLAFLFCSPPWDAASHVPNLIHWRTDSPTASLHLLLPCLTAGVEIWFSPGRQRSAQ